MAVKVVIALKDANLQLNREKSEFYCAQVEYLRYVVNEQGVRTNIIKVQPVIEFLTSTNVKQLLRFLRIIGWYSRFIKNSVLDHVTPAP